MCCKARRQQRLAAAAALAVERAQVRQSGAEVAYGEPPSYAVANGQYIPQNNGYDGGGCHGSRRGRCGRVGGGRRFPLWSLFSRRGEQMHAPSKELEFDHEVKNADDGLKGFVEMSKTADDTSRF